MWPITKLGERFNLSERQVRLRLTALGVLLHDMTSHGQYGKIVLNDAGFQLFDRLMQLEANGQGTSGAVETLCHELGKTQSETASITNVNPGEPLTLDAEPPSDSLVSALQGRIDDLLTQLKEVKADKERLWSQVEESQAQVQAMLPVSTDSRQRIGRLQALRIALLGQ